VEKWRDDCINIADHIVTECDLYKKSLSVDSQKVTTLHLFKEQSEVERELVEEIINSRKSESGLIRFAYLGSMNNIIDIDGISEVIRNCIENGLRCELHAVGKGDSKDAFISAVQNTGCKVFYYGAVFDEKEKIRILAPCDFAFNMMKTDVSVGLTIKSIDYFSYGLPIINNIKGDTWELVENEKLGINLPEMQYNMGIRDFDHHTILSVFNNLFTKQRFESNVLELIEKV